MAKERKRVERKEIKPVAPKKRPNSKAKVIVKKKVEPEQPKPKKPKSEDKYVRIAADAPQEEFSAIGERVRLGEIKWAYYAFDTNKGYHHYLVLPKTNK